MSLKIIEIILDDAQILFFISTVIMFFKKHIYNWIFFLLIYFK